MALPTLVTRLHATATGLQWISDAYTLVFASLLLTAGSLSDRYGRRGTLLARPTIFGGFCGVSQLAACRLSLSVQVKRTPRFACQ